MIETTKIFGVVSLKADSTSWKGLVGTTAEIFEYIDADDGNAITNEDPRSITYPFQDCTDGKIVTEKQFTQTGLLMNHQILLQKTV